MFAAGIAHSTQAVEQRLLTRHDVRKGQSASVVHAVPLTPLKHTVPPSSRAAHAQGAGQLPFTPWQSHAPWMHAFVAHVCPQAPQLAPLVARSVHTPVQQVRAPQPPQHSVVGMHVAPHTC